MKKLVFLVALGSMLLAACGGGSGALTATVNGEQITVADVEALLAGDNSTVERGTFATNLGFKIQFLITKAAADADYGITHTDEQVSERADSLYTSLRTGEETLEEFLVARNITETMLNEVARQGLISEDVRVELEPEVVTPADEEIAEAQQFALAQLTNGCISHILVDTEGEANDVLDRLDNGEEFSDVATDVSTDTASAEAGGALGCSTFEQWVAPFRDASLVATVGEVVSEPVESQFGFHIILVTDRVDPDEAAVPTTEDILAQLEAQALESLYSEWFFAAIAAADVAVEPEYGTWESAPPAGPAVVPPDSE